MKKCSYCAEEIEDEAIKCKHCGEMLDGSKLPETGSKKQRKRTEINPGFGFLIILIISIFVIKSIYSTELDKRSSNKRPATNTNPVQTIAKSPVRLPTYKVLNEEVTDIPAKAQIVQTLIVSGDISELTLRNMLNKVYSALSVRRGFEYYKVTTNIYLYAYT